MLTMFGLPKHKHYVDVCFDSAIIIVIRRNASEQFSIVQSFIRSCRTKASAPPSSSKKPQYSGQADHGGLPVQPTTGTTDVPVVIIIGSSRGILDESTHR
jgi:hypothetical protein